MTCSPSSANHQNGNAPIEKKLLKETPANKHRKKDNFFIEHCTKKERVISQKTPCVKKDSGFDFFHIHRMSWLGKAYGEPNRHKRGDDINANQKTKLERR